MKPRSKFLPLAFVLTATTFCAHAQLLLTEVQSDGLSDFWELTNTGTTAVDLSGWKWIDSARSITDKDVVTIPSGTSIAVGESMIFTTSAAGTFRTQWGLSTSVQVIEGGPGLGKDDGITLYNAAGVEQFYFTYAKDGFTQPNGTSAIGGHAGISGGGSTAKSLIWDISSGIASPRYVAATGNTLGTFTAPGDATNAGSPGYSGFTASTPQVTLSLTTSVSSFSEGAVNPAAIGTVTRALATANPLVVTLSSSNTNEATVPATVTIPENQTSVTFAINAVDDAIVDGDKTVVFTASAPDANNPTATITVLDDDVAAPGIFTQPASTSIVSGTSTTLSVSVSGSPAPQFQWYLGEKGDTSHPIAEATSATFLTPVLSETARYWVRVTNAVGSVDSDTVVVTIVANATSIDLSTYVRVGRYALPEPTRTALPLGTPTSNLLCQEASGVAYNWDTDTLFIVGDGARSVTQVSKTGELIDTMTLALGSSPQGTDFYDVEGITYIGNGEFVFTEERDRQLVKFTYAAGTTLSRSATKTVKLGTFVNNIGIEGLSYDPQTGGFICVKEISPMGIFQTNIDFDAGTATNGSPTTVNSVNLFDPALLGMSDFADVFALSNLPSMAGQPQAGNLLVISQESARIVNTDRLGNIHSSLQIVADPGSLLSAADQQHEGLTMDRAGRIYVVNENGGGDIDHPQLWVYAPSTAANQPPTAVSVVNAVSSILENSSTVVPVKVGDLLVTDDGLGTNTFTLTGPDAAYFEIINSALYLKAGVVLDYETKASYQVTIQVDDLTVGATPDASVNFTLTVIDIVDEGSGTPTVFISEVNPTGSSNGTYNADWFEVTNAGTTDVNITGWQMDDDSNGTAKVPLRGLTIIPAGKSAIFFEGTADGSTDATIIANFSNAWFGTPTPPAGFLIGAYGGGGVGLSSGGDAVNLFDAAGKRVAGVSFGAATLNVTFDNKAGMNSVVTPLPALTVKSVAGVNGAFVSANAAETGSPGTTGRLLITEVAPWSSGSPVGADWFEVTNTGATTVNLTGWKMDDNSESPAGAVALNGVSTIAPGERVIFLETATPSTTIPKFLTNWFGANPPAGLQVGSYSGSGVGLSGDGDAVNLYDSNNVRQANVSFGASPAASPFATFDNSEGVNFGVISKLSIPGVNGGFIAKGVGDQIGSPGDIANSGPLDFARWLEVNGISSTGFATDSNHNGVMDGVDFYFNLKDKSGLGHLPTLTTVDGDKVLTYTTLDGVSGVSGVLEHSEDLGMSDAWTPAVLGVDYQILSATSAGGQTTTSLRLIDTSSTKKFWRHRVIQN